MHKHTQTLSILLTLATLIFFVSPVCSASIKDRMAERLPAITQLKNSGVVGENNKGFLEFRQAKTSEQLVNDENKDRTAVYNAIAQKQGVSAELVGKRRAKMIAEIGTAGQWFQKDDGSWYKK
jgi:uncharacterized protein YdbL (DUF1318 family)